MTTFTSYDNYRLQELAARNTLGSGIILSPTEYKELQDLVRQKVLYDRELAQAEEETAYNQAQAEFTAITAKLGRATLTATFKDGSTQDVTEDVVTLVDLFTNSLDWGSGFYSLEDIKAVSNLATILAFPKNPAIEYQYTWHAELRRTGKK